jgi:hypothetical protein
VTTPTFDVVATGPDAAELAAVLRWPALTDGAFGHRALIHAAAALRVLEARRAIARLSLRVTLTGPGADAP